MFYEILEATKLLTISSVSAVIAKLKKRQKKLCNPVSVSSCIRRTWNFENILRKKNIVKQIPLLRSSPKRTVFLTGKCPMFPKLLINKIQFF